MSRQSRRMLLADQNVDVRHALALLLRTALDLEVVGEAGDFTGLSARSREQADLLLVEWAGIALEAPGLLAELRALNERLRIVVLSTQPEDRTAAIAAGADAFISKVDPPDQVLAVVRAVLTSG